MDLANLRNNKFHLLESLSEQSEPDVTDQSTEVHIKMSEEHEQEEDHAKQAVFFSSILVNIFQYLPKCDQLRASRVCRYWAATGRDCSLWREIYIKKKDKVNMRLLRDLTKRSDNLKVLDLSNSSITITSHFEDILRDCPNLQTLKLPERVRLNWLPENISRCKQLQTLSYFKSVSLNDEYLGFIVESCSDLRSLSFNQCPKITVWGLMIILQIGENLKDLEIGIQSTSIYGLFTIVQRIAEEGPFLDNLIIYVYDSKTCYTPRIVVTIAFVGNCTIKVSPDDPELFDFDLAYALDLLRQKIDERFKRNAVAVPHRRRTLCSSIQARAEQMHKKCVKNVPWLTDLPL